MPPTKQCPDCKVAVHIRQKVCDRCHHAFRSKRIAEYKANEKSIKRAKNEKSIKRARASESDSMKSVRQAKDKLHKASKRVSETRKQTRQRQHQDPFSQGKHESH